MEDTGNKKQEDLSYDSNSSESCLAQRRQLHDDEDGRLGADPDQADDVFVVELLHDVCNNNNIR